MSIFSQSSLKGSYSRPGTDVKVIILSVLFLIRSISLKFNGVLYEARVDIRGIMIDIKRRIFGINGKGDFPIN